MLLEDDLHKYQKRAATFICENKSAALWIDMGLGKTAATLTALKELLDTSQAQKILIIAPLRVTTHTWPTEMKTWDHLKGLSYTQLSGLSPTKREHAVTMETPIHLINREMVPWLVTHFGQKWPYETVVIDESSSFKSSAAKRWKSLRKVLGKIDRMVQLTGTPAPNSLMDLWPQIYLLDKGERLGDTKTKFLEKYCTIYGNPSWRQYQVRPDRVDVMKEKIRDLVLRMSADEYLELPDRVDSFVEVKLKKKALDLYKKMEKQFIIELEEGTVTAANAAVKIGKLLQICNGAIYHEDKSFTEIDTGKLDALAEICETANEPILVAFQFRSDVRRILSRVKGSKLLGKDPKTIDAWNNKEIPVLLAHPASAGHGLNLQAGGNIVVWFGLPWALELYQQFNARLHRQGQTNPVRVIHLLTDCRAETLVNTALNDKLTIQDSVLDAYKKTQ